MSKYFMIFFSLFVQYGVSFLLAFSVSELSLEEKVGQVLMVHFHGQEANEEAKDLIQEMHIGGIIYYNWANGLKDPQQVQNLSQGLQQLARQTPHAIPLLIAIDQEGGRISRLKGGFTVFPGNYALGQTREWLWGEESAWMMGEELKAVGVSLNLAPVIDVYTQPANPVIGIRAFSSDPAQVACWGAYALRGYKRAGVIAVLKHFPGHGDVEVDSHEVLPIISKERDVLDQIELLPFRFLAPQAEVMMTAHLLVPALDDQHCVTFSKKIVSDLLRNEWGFQGVLMTDSLAMEGVLSQCSSLEEVVLRSLNAGHDIILLGGKQLLSSQNGLEFTVDDIKRVQHFLIEAVKRGQLSEARLDDAVMHILALKKRSGLYDFDLLEASLLQNHVYTASHCALAQQIARRALHIVKGESMLPLTFETGSLLIIAPECLQEELNQTAWQSLGPQVKIHYFKGLSPDQATIEEIKVMVAKADKSLFFAYNTWQFLGQQKLFQSIQQVSPCTLAIAVCDLVDAKNLASADLLLCTFSPVACSLQAAFDYLTQKLD